MNSPKDQFNKLSITDKAILIAEFATFIQSVEYYDYRVHLYTMNNQYLEVYYNLYNRAVEEIKIADYKDLDKYTLKIQLPNFRKNL